MVRSNLTLVNLTGKSVRVTVMGVDEYTANMKPDSDTKILSTEFEKGYNNIRVRVNSLDDDVFTINTDNVMTYYGGTEIRISLVLGKTSDVYLDPIGQYYVRNGIYKKISKIASPKLSDSQFEPSKFITIPITIDQEAQLESIQDSSYSTWEIILLFIILIAVIITVPAIIGLFVYIIYT